MILEIRMSNYETACFSVILDLTNTNKCVVCDTWSRENCFSVISCCRTPRKRRVLSSRWSGSRGPRVKSGFMYSLCLRQNLKRNVIIHFYRLLQNTNDVFPVHKNGIRGRFTSSIFNNPYRPILLKFNKLKEQNDW
jgi:hypothetical protein